MSTALDLYGISGVVVMLDNLNRYDPSFDGDLKAHVRFYEGNFYVFISELSREESIKVISHEVIHISQYFTRELEYNDGVVKWRGVDYDLNTTLYNERPWEEDAFRKESDLYTKVYNVLY
jgi:hypothetical protein